MKSRELALLSAKMLDQKKAKDIIIIDIEEKSGFADYLLVATAASMRQMSSLADELQDGLAEEGIMMSHQEGRGNSGWILMDYGDIIINIFTEPQREKYQIEKVWMDCPRLDFESSEEAISKREAK